MSAGCDDADPTAPATAVAAPAAPLAVEAARESPAVPAAAETPAAKPPAAIEDATFDDIKLDMPAGATFSRSLITPHIEKLFGARIRIRGYMLPSFQQTGIRQFVLVRDNMQCCFGPGAALYDCILVEMEGSESVDYTVRPVTVAGTFQFNELLDADGKHLAIYHMRGEAVD